MRKRKEEGIARGRGALGRAGGAFLPLRGYPLGCPYLTVRKDTNLREPAQGRRKAGEGRAKRVFNICGWREVGGGMAVGKASGASAPSGARRSFAAALTGSWRGHGRLQLGAENLRVWRGWRTPSQMLERTGESGGAPPR